MNEIEILKALIDKEQRKHYLDIHLDFTTDIKEQEALKEKRSQLSREIEDDKLSLLQIEDKTFSAKSHSCMIAQLSEYINQIVKANKGLKLTRDQGLILDNYLFSIITRDIEYFVENKCYGIRTPRYLHYTSSNENSVDIPELIEFLEEEIIALNNLQKISFITLREYFEEFKIRIIKRFID